ncbi:MAG: lasso peptide biosynthesis B2 protein [Actinobacteria bacterium]|nr:lasso peptide biosynthesis B2 protein [Actinomycetota bacterium]
MHPWKIKAVRLAEELRLSALAAAALPRAVLFPGRELKRLQWLPVRAGKGRGAGEETVLRCAGRWFALLDRMRLRTSCLTRSLVLARLLRREGHDARLVFGVRSDNGRREGHCWVSVRGREVAGKVPGFEELHYDERR